MSYITDGHLVEIASGAERINATLERIADALETLVEQGKPTVTNFDYTTSLVRHADPEPEVEPVFIDKYDYLDLASRDLFSEHLRKTADGDHVVFDGFFQLNEAGLALLGEFHDPEPVVKSDESDYDSMVLIHEDDLDVLDYRTQGIDYGYGYGYGQGYKAPGDLAYDAGYRLLKPEAVAAMGEFYPEVLEGAEAYGAAPVGTLVRGPWIGHDLRKMNSTHWLDLHSTGESYHSTHLSASRKVLYWGAAA